MQLAVLFSAFVMVSTVWSVYCFLFYSRCPVPYGVGADAYRPISFDSLSAVST